MSKRKRPETQPSGAADAEAQVLSLIRSRKGSGIWKGEIKLETHIPEAICSRALKSLLKKNLIKEVPNVQKRGKKDYMAIEFEPSEELSGGDFYTNGELDTELIDSLKAVFHRYILSKSAATLEGIHSAVVKMRIVTFNITREQVGEILNSLVLDNRVIEVKSTGLGDYFSIPRGTTCYRVVNAAGVARGPSMATFASIPCGSCTRVDMCTSHGLVSPSTCVYYKKWLDIEF